MISFKTEISGLQSPGVSVRRWIGMPDRKSVSIAGDGIEIGRLQIHMDEKRTSHIKNQILEARFDEPATLEQTGSKF